MGGTGACRPRAAATDDSAMGPDLDLQDDRILGAREVGEGRATGRTTARLRGESLVLDNGREVGIIASFRPRPAALLASGPARRRPSQGPLRGRRFGRSGGLGLLTEELLLAE